MWAGPGAAVTAAQGPCTLRLATIVQRHSQNKLPGRPLGVWLSGFSNAAKHCSLGKEALGAHLPGARCQSLTLLCNMSPLVPTVLYFVQGAGC